MHQLYAVELLAFLWILAGGSTVTAACEDGWWCDFTADPGTWRFHQGETPGDGSTGRTGGWAELLPSAEGVVEGSFISRLYGGEQRGLHVTYSLSHNATLGIKIQETDSPTIPVETLQTSQTLTPGWHHTCVDVSGNGPFQLVFEGRAWPASTGHVMLKDVSVLQGPCQSQALDTQLQAPVPATGVNCTFEAGVCGYTADNSTELTWTRAQGRVDSIRGPSGDHTTGQGYYLYVDSTTNGTARITSPPIPTTRGSPVCLTFWFHMFGGTSGTLRVYLTTGGRRLPVWVRSGSHANVWRRGQRTLQSTEDYQITFEAVMGGLSSVVTALDDVLLVNGRCPTEPTCDFEADLCDLRVDGDDSTRYRWERASNLTAVSPSSERPEVDHTTGTGQGFYVYTIKHKQFTPGDNAILTLHTYTPTTAAQCGHFWYYMQGSTAGVLNVYIRRKSVQGAPVWTMNGDKGTQWVYGQVNIQGKDPWELMFEALAEVGRRGVIALDDIRVTEGPCPPPASCDFERDLCGYENWRAEGYSWLRTAGQALKGARGPMVDHTTNSDQGFYIFTAGSLGYGGKQATLRSEYIQPAQEPSCLTFWCHTYGAAQSQLVVSLVPEVGPVLELLRVGTSDGDGWQKKEARIQYSGTFRVQFVSVEGPNGKGQIALDDVLYTPGVACGVTPTTPPPTTTTTQAPSVYDCTFDDKTLCSWRDSPETFSKFKFMRGLDKDGPKVDHSLGSQEGYYIIFREHYLPANKSIRVQSPLVTTSGQDVKCFRFWYHIFGSKVNRLNIYLKDSENPSMVGDPIWRRVGTAEDQWTYGQVTLDKNSTSSVVIEAVSGQNWNGDIAIDDMSIIDGPCHTVVGSCDFEAADQCGYVTDRTVKAVWTRGRGMDGHSNIPPTDHTYGTHFGHYMYVPSTNESRGQSARLVSPTYSATSDSCLRYWYRLEGNSLSSLRVYILRQGRRQALWRESGEDSRRWRVRQLPLNSYSKFQVLFEAVLGGLPGSIALDDVTMTSEPCDQVGSCDFERDMCTYTDDKRTDYQWVRHRGDALTPYVTGPVIDHTVGTPQGWYMFMDLNRGHGKGDVGRFRSALLPAGSASRCLRFWYLASGKHPGTLRVYTETFPSRNQTVLLTRIDPNSRGAWLLQQLGIEPSEEEFSIVFQGETGFSYTGGIAIDDVKVTPGACPRPTQTPPMYDCGDGTSVKMEQVCDFHVDCPTGRDESHCGNCTFEAGTFCSWTDRSRGSSRWKLGSGSVLGKDKGPSTDHTLGTDAGKYAYVDANLGGRKASATLESSRLQLAGSSCKMTLWYHIVGVDIGHLRVSVKLTNIAQETILWYRSTQQDTRWLKADIYLPRITVPYTILLEADRSFSKTGHIAVDDLSLSSCGLPPVRPFRCPPGLKTCHRGSCYDPYQECDYTDDCGDFTDESAVLCGTYPSRCDFENGLCGWTLEGDKQYHWRRHKGETPSFGTGPTRDHTTGLVQGTYIFADASRTTAIGAETTLTSQIWEATNGTTINNQCYMTFYYHMLGANIGGLRLKLLTLSGKLQYMFDKYGNQNDTWHRTILFMTSHEPYVIQFVAIRGAGYQGDIAIDDVTFSPGCVLYKGPPITLPPTTAHTTPSTTQASCPIGQRPCKNHGQCVKSEDFCNFRYDCRDGSDEESCPQACTFEQGTLCHWTSVTDPGKANWRVTSGAKLGHAEGPLRDHTLNSKDGQYTYLNNVAGGSAATLQSATYQQSGTTCQMSFWYNVNGTSTLRLSITTNTKEKLLWQQPTTNSQTQPTWTLVKIKLPVCSKRFYMKFTGEVKTQEKAISYVAIDDIRFDTCEYPLPSASCPAGQFVCGTGHCVSTDAKCDFQTDCCDSSDEKPELCQGYDRCDFESDLCNAKPLSEGQLQWVRYLASEGPGPLRDHTLESATGHYVSISTPKVPGQAGKARLAYNLNSTDTNSPCSMRFWYNNPRYSLNIYQRTAVQGEETLLRSINPNKDSIGWSRISIDLMIHDPFQVILEGVLAGDSVPGPTVSIDDVSFTEGCVKGSGIPITPAPTPPPPCLPDQFTCGDGSCLPTYKVCDFKKDCPDGKDEATCPAFCDFESGQCGWNETMENGFDWKRGSGDGTLDRPSSAPRSDHTLGGMYGHYMYLSNSQSTDVVKNKQNLLLSANYKKALASCKVQFYYYIDGRATGVVNLAVKRQDKADLLLWSTKDSLDSKWRFSKVGLGARERPFQVAIWRDPTYRFAGVVAVDDIRFTGCAPPPARVECASDRFWCISSRACISMDKLCDLEDDCGDTSDEDLERCAPYTRVDFEDGLRIFTHGRIGVEDDFNWSIGSGATTTKNTGPSFDHTTGRETGKYLYINARAQKYGQKAWLVSTPFQPTTDGTCRMRLWYHMYGLHVNRLAVYYRLTQDGRPDGVLWERQGPVGAYWERADFNVLLNQTFQIIIEATVGDRGYGDIAIDDVSFTPSCKSDSRQLPVATTATPPATTGTTTVSHTCDSEKEFNCHNSGKCLPKDRVCDFRIDCVDGSDEGHCTRRFCNFEGGEMCNWTPQQTSEGAARYRWEDVQAGAPSTGGTQRYRPQVDHSTQTSSGWYLWADSSPGEHHDRATLWSTTISRTGPQCTLSFWYHMTGMYVGSLHVMTDTRHGGRHQHWYQSGPKRDAWQLAQVFLGPRTDFWVIIEARRGRFYQGDISVDDMSFGDCEPVQLTGRVCTDTEFRCKNTYCIGRQYLCDYADHCADNSDEQKVFCDDTYVYRCDFEFNICPTWHQDQDDDDFDWTLTQGGSTTPATGPQGDHTTGTGSYLYIETTYSVKKGDIARLSSNFIKGTSKNCQVRFWYHMKGDNIGSLSVLMRYKDKTDTLQHLVLYNVTGEQSQLWLRGAVNISPYIQNKADFQVVFEASVGGRARGDIALDDISLTPGCESGPPPTETPPTTMPPGVCGPYSFLCRDGSACFHQSQRCNFIQQCKDGTDEQGCGGDCDFEGDDLCGWSNSYRSTLDWVRRSGPTPTRDTGPEVDHTLGTNKGHYLYIETRLAKPGDRAHLESALYRMTGAKCRLTFWFHMFGAKMGRLSVYVKSKSQSTRPVFQIEGDQGKQWKKADILLGHRRNFALVFEGTSGGRTGNMALDDIKFVSCRPDTKLASCRHEDFLCSDQLQCIPKYRLCDRRVDCRDGSDENLKLCPGVRGNCDFEGNWQKLCRWQQAQDDDADWHQGALTPAPDTGPTADHTIGRGGHFLYINSLNMDAGEVARILTPQFPSSYGVCHVRFWYHMFGDKGMGTLQVYTRSPTGQRVLLWRRSGNQGDQWQYALVSVGSNHNFSLVFEAVRGDSIKSDVALDDVTFIPECVTGRKSVLPSCSPDEFYCEVQAQCLPKTWVCDGEVDCPDGSDESNCRNSTVVGSTPDPRRFWTVGPQTCPQHGRFRCKDGSCILGNLYCDGVKDCPQGDDEFGCRHTCHRDGGQTYCRPTASCLPPEYRCDGQQNCPDGSDEAGCSECISNFCLNGGKCWVQQRLGINCNCTDTGYEGYRCRYKDETSVKPIGGQNQKGMTWLGVGLGISCGVLLIICIMLSIYIMQIRRQSRNRERNNHSPWADSMDNPLYNATEMAASFQFENNNSLQLGGKTDTNGNSSTS